MPRPGRRALQTSGLLLLVLVAAVALLPLLGAPAMLLPTVGWVAGLMVGFILIQLAVFRLFGLSSRADDAADEADAAGAEPREPGVEIGGESGTKPDQSERDWRIWRG